MNTETLKNFGLSENESKVFLTLLRLKIATAKEIELNTNIPLNKIYGIIEKLKNKQLANYVSVNPKKVSLINPESYLKKSISEKKAEFAKIELQTNNLIKIANSKPQDFHDSFLIIKGQDKILDKILEENTKAKKGILSCHGSFKVFKNALHITKEGVTRGIEHKMLGNITTDTLERAKKYKSIGVKIKMLDKKFENNPLRFTVFDEKKVRITIGRPEIQNKSDYLTLWIESESFAKVMKRVFEQLWNESKEF